MQLSNIKIFLPRSEERALKFVDAVTNVGGEVHVCPLLQIVNLVAPNLDAVIAAADIIIVMSVNAVYALKDSSNKLSDVTVCAIGTSTEAALTDLGLVNVIVPADHSSEGLLQLGLLQRFNAEKIVLLSGEDSRSLLAEQLNARGAEVVSLAVYKRVPVELSVAQLKAYTDLMCNGEVNIIIFHSVTLVEYFKGFFANIAPVWRKITCFAVSERVAAHCAQYFDNVYNIASTSDAAIIAKLSEFNKEMNMSESNNDSEIKGIEGVVMQPGENDNRAGGDKKYLAIMIAVVALLVALAAIGFSYWLYNTRSEATYDLQNQQVQFEKLKQQINAEVTQAEASIAEAQKKISDTMQQKILAAGSELNEHLSQQQQMIQANADKLNKVLNINTQQQTSYILSEVGYLVRMAALNINIMDDTEHALTLLQTAQQQILDSGNAALEPLVKTLQQDAEMVQSRQKIDRVQLVDNIYALSQQVENLPLIPARIQAQQNKQTNVPAKTGNKVQDHWNTAVYSIKGLFVIRHLDAPIEPLLAPDQLMFMRENISMKLFQAQWAVLHRQQNLYVQSLQQARDLLSKYFSQNAAGSSKLIDSIDDLLKESVVAPMPNLQSTISAINQMQKSLQDGAAKNSVATIAEQSNTITQHDLQPASPAVPATLTTQS
jgi:uroporphyrin-3 C-methyltransferase